MLGGKATVFIAIVDVKVAPADRAAALAALLGAAPGVRAMPGNLAFRAFLDSGRPEAVRILHEWADAHGFAAYGRSEAFRLLGARASPHDDQPAPQPALPGRSRGDGRLTAPSEQAVRRAEAFSVSGRFPASPRREFRMNRHYLLRHLGDHAARGGGTGLDAAPPPGRP